MGYRPDLRETAKEWRRLLYSRITNIFTYENLPEEINEQAFKLFLFYKGKIIFYKIKDKFLIQPFTYTNQLNWYYIPKCGRVVNPWLPTGFQNKEFNVDDEAIIWNSTPDIYNFKEWGLVADLVHKTAYQLAENDISYYCIQRNHRLIAIFTAENDLEKAECNRILERIYEGYPDVTMQEDLVSHIRVNPIAMNSTRSSITELIEFQQYVLANFYHSFGINSNYNLKREQLNSNEIDVNEEVLRLNIEDMLKCRQKGIEKVNDLYGLNIVVSLNETVYQKLLQEAEVGGNSMDGQLLSANDNISREETSQGLSESGRGNNILRSTSGDVSQQNNEEDRNKNSGNENGTNTQDEISGDTSKDSVSEDSNNISDTDTSENDETSKDIQVDAEVVNIIVTEKSKIETNQEDEQTKESDKDDDKEQDSD